MGQCPTHRERNPATGGAKDAGELSVREDDRFKAEDPLTREIIGAAIAVHKALGPGLLESVYSHCLQHELGARGMGFRAEVPVGVSYRDVSLDCGFRMDLVVEELVIVELKAVETLLPIHEAQLLTYLRLAGKRVGLMFNFNSVYLRDAIVRRVV